MKLVSLCLLTFLLLVGASRAENKVTVKSITQAYIKASGLNKLTGGKGTLVMKGTQTTTLGKRDGKPLPIAVYQQLGTGFRVETILRERSKLVVTGNAGKSFCGDVYERQGRVRVHKSIVRPEPLKIFTMIGDPLHIGKLDKYFDKVELAGTKKVRGTDCHVIAAQGKGTGEAEFLISKDGDLMQFTFALFGPKAKMIVDFIKWRKMKDVRLPETMIVSMPAHRITCKIVFKDWQMLEKFEHKDYFSVTKPALGPFPKATK